MWFLLLLTRCDDLWLSTTTTVANQLICMRISFFFCYFVQCLIVQIRLLHGFTLNFQYFLCACNLRDNTEGVLCAIEILSPDRKIQQKKKNEKREEKRVVYCKTVHKFESIVACILIKYVPCSAFEWFVIKNLWIF